VSLLYRLRSLWRNLVHRDRVELDVDDEMRAVFDLLVAEKTRAGMQPADARRAATLELGRIEVVKAQVRDVKMGAFVDGVLQDLRYGARVLRRNPIFTLTAALSLAIGIGATTTIFTVANALLLRASPGVSEPGRLVDIVPTMKGHFGLILTPHAVYLEVRERITTLQDVYAYELEPKPLSLRVLRPDSGQGAEAAERVFAGTVTLNYFGALGVPAAAGRVFGAGDGEAGAGSPVVLSHDFWVRRFNADPAVIGRPLQINGQPFAVAGVAREGFRGMSVAAPDLWIPVAADAAQLMTGGRLKPGVSRAQAAAELNGIGRGLARENPNKFGGLEWSVASSSPLPAILRGVAAAFIGLLMALVSIVLVIACANVAGVLLARATARRREIAVRVTLGAGRARLVRQLLTETALLFVIGGTGGVALARGMTSLLLAALPAFPVPVNLSLPLDGRVLAFAGGLSLIAAVLSGMAPALHASRADVISALKDESQGPSDRLRLRNAFVVAQVAFSILLVVAAGLLGRALGRVTALDQGFDSKDVEVAAIDLSMAGYTDDSGRVFARELVERLRKLPGVESATLSDRVPGGPLQMEATKRRRGESVPVEPPPVPWSVTLVEAGYFATLRIPLVAGRAFSTADRRGTQAVAIVDESTARRLWPGEEAVGKFLPSVPGRISAQDPTPRLVIGVAASVAQSGGAMRTPALVVYAPLQQVYGPQLTILARTIRGERRAGAIRALVTAMNPNLPILAAHTLEERQTGPVVLQLRIAALVSGTVGLVGLMLASIGIYGVTAYAIARRTREIGIRMTLGAQRADVVRMVLRQGMTLVAIGAGIGLLLAALAGRVLARLLFGLPPLDPVTFGGATLLFAAIGLAACYVPIRRATHINPVEALRYE
jgi:putative ABC transport system permease protein